MQAGNVFEALAAFVRVNGGDAQLTQAAHFTPVFRAQRLLDHGRLIRRQGLDLLDRLVRLPGLVRVQKQRTIEATADQREHLVIVLDAHFDFQCVVAGGQGFVHFDAHCSHVGHADRESRAFARAVEAEQAPDGDIQAFADPVVQGGVDAGDGGPLVAVPCNQAGDDALEREEVVAEQWQHRVERVLAGFQRLPV